MLLVGGTVVGTAALAACGGSSGQAALPKEHAPATIAVENQAGDAVTAVRDRVMAMFSAAYPWIRVEETMTSGTAATLQRILTLVAGGTPPDVVYLHPSYVTDLAEKGVLVDLGPLAAKERDVDLPDFYPGPFDHFRYKNVLYGLPFNSGPTVTFFNRTLLTRLGVTPPDQRERAGKWNWDALREVARVTSQGSGDTRTMGLQAANLNLDWFDAWVWQAGGDVFSKDLKKCLLAERPAIEAAQFIADLYLKEKAIPVGPDTQQFPGGIESGRVAMRIGIKGQTALVTQKAAQAGFSLGMAPTPKGSAARANRDGPQAYGAVKGAKQPDAAWAYVKYMASLETQKVRLETKVTVPVRKSAAKLPEFNRSLEAWEVGEWWLEAASTTRSLPKPARYAEIDKLWVDSFTKTIGGQVPVRSALEDAARQIDALLG
jgi:ABC-type glycerol-3-phosphate transport system substrate-binding protein